MGGWGFSLVIEMVGRICFRKYCYCFFVLGVFLVFGNRTSVSLCGEAVCVVFVCCVGF